MEKDIPISEKYIRKFDPQRMFEKKKRQTLEEIVEDGMRFSVLILGDTKWELIGSGTNKISASLKINEERTVELMSSHIMRRIRLQIEQNELWSSRGGEHYDSYQDNLLALRELKDNFMSGESVLVAIHPLKNPNHDKSLDPVVLLQNSI